LIARQEDRRWLDLDEEFLIGKTRHADPCRAWRLVAERRLQGSADRLAFVDMALPNVEPQCADLI
jgi:hypothetical protein